jgi:transcriptional regulator with XRE-family HTH domain
MNRGQIQEIRLEVSEWVQCLRIRTGLTLDNAAILLGETSERLSGLENGNPIPLDRLASLAKMYQVSDEEFLQKMSSLQKKYLEGQKP